MFNKEGEGIDFKFNLGDEVKDKITGFSGIILWRSQWLHNCNTYGILSKKLKDGKPQETSQFDEPRIELLKKKVIKPKRDTGGPTDNLSPTNRK